MSENFIADMTEFAVLLIFTVAVVIFTVKLVKAIKKHIPLKKSIIFLGISVVLLSSAVLFVLSHGHCYKYNDWYVMGNDINKVVERYGKFDKGSVEIDKSGKIGYYIYTDNGPVMASYLPYYYYIYYDENGVVYKVDVMGAEGG